MAGFEAGQVHVPIKPDMAGFQQGVSAGLKSLGASMQNMGRSLTKNVTLPIMALGGLAVKSFFEAEKVVAQTEAVIKSTGGAANVTSGEIGKLSEKIMGYSGISDEAVQSGANMLLTFKNIRNEAGAGNDIFNQATTALADMSVALGKDMSTSAIQLGKALNDPIKGVTALGRAGVQFTDQQKAQIETLVASGKTMQAQKMILKELESQFGGSAKAMGETSEGQFKIAMERLGNVGEQFGAMLVPIVVKVAEFVTSIAKFMADLDGPAKQLILIFAGVVAAVGPLLLIIGKVVSLAGTLGPVFTAIGGAISLPLVAIAALVAGFALAYAKVEWFRDGVNAAVKAVADFITPAFKAVSTFIQQTWAQISQWTKDHWDQIKEAVTRVINAVKIVIDTFIGAIKAAWKLWGDELVATLKVAWTLIKDTIKAAIQIVQGIIETVMALINGDWGRAWDGIKNVLSGAWEAIKGVVRAAVGVMQQVISGALSAIKGLWNTAWDTLKSVMNNTWDGIKSGVRNGIGEVIDFLKALPGKMLSAVGNLGNLLYEAGRAVITGLIRGITSVLGSLWDTVGGIAGKIADLKGPIPKDLKLLVPAGKAIMQGLQRGLQEGFDDLVAPTLKNITLGGFTAPFEASISGTSGIGSDLAGSITNNHSPNITVYGGPAVIDEARLLQLTKRAELLASPI